MGGAARRLFRQSRTETEQRHFEFLKAEVEVARTMLELALSESVTDAAGAAEGCLRSSKRAHATVVKFLSEPKYALADEDRAWVQAKVTGLECRLEGLAPSLP